MSTTQQEFEQFRQFVEQHLAAGELSATLDELFDQWRHDNPSPHMHAEDIAAIAASIEDFRHGERGTLAGTHSAELRREFGISDQ